MIDGGQPTLSMTAQAAWTCRLPRLRLIFRWAVNSVSKEVEIGGDTFHARGLFDLVEPGAAGSDGLQDGEIVTRFAQLLLKEETHLIVEKGAPGQGLLANVGEQRLEGRYDVQISGGAAEEGISPHL